MNSTASVINFQEYLDPDYGLLIPKVQILVALGVTDHQLRSVQPMLTFGEDFIKVPGQGAIERIFYSAVGLLKLCDAIATPQAQQFKAQLERFTQPAAPTAPQNAALVPSPSQPFTMPSRGEFDPYAPAQRGSAASYIVPASHGGMNPLAAAQRSAPAYPGVHTDDPAAIVSQQLAPHLAPVVAAQVAQQIMPMVHGAIARLQEKERQQPKELTQAELMFEQQKISLQQFQEMQQMVLGAQQAGLNQTATMMDVAKPQTFVIQGGGMDDLIALMRSEGFQLLVGLVAFAFALVAAFGFFSRSSDPVPLPDPTTGAPIAPIAPAPVAPVAPVPTAPPAPAAPATPVPGYYYPPTTAQ